MQDTIWNLFGGKTVIPREENIVEKFKERIISVSPCCAVGIQTKYAFLSEVFLGFNGAISFNVFQSHVVFTITLLQ